MSSSTVSTRPIPRSLIGQVSFMLGQEAVKPEAGFAGGGPTEWRGQASGSSTKSQVGRTSSPSPVGFGSRISSGLVASATSLSSHGSPAWKYSCVVIVR